MAKRGFQVFDSDMHVLEPPDLWQRYMDPGLRDQAPVGLTEWPMDLRIRLGDRNNPAHTGSAIQTQKDIAASQLEQYADDLERNFDATAQLMAMDKEGIDQTVLFPSRGLYAHAFDDLEPHLSQAISRAYNDWLSDFCRDGDPKRMKGAAMLPVHDVSMAVDEAHRAAHSLDFPAVFLRPNPVRHGEYWEQPKYDPLWRQIQDLDIALGFHEGMNSGHPTVGHDRWDPGEQFALKHAVSHSMEQMMAVASFTLGGVLDRSPTFASASWKATAPGSPSGSGAWTSTWSGPASSSIAPSAPVPASSSIAAASSPSSARRPPSSRP